MTIVSRCYCTRRQWPLAPALLDPTIKGMESFDEGTMPVLTITISSLWLTFRLSSLLCCPSRKVRQEISAITECRAVCCQEDHPPELNQSCFLRPFLKVRQGTDSTGFELRQYKVHLSRPVGLHRKPYSYSSTCPTIPIAAVNNSSRWC